MILVTGASGFIGQALCRDLVARGHDTAGAYRDNRPDRIPLGVDARQISDLSDANPWRETLLGVESVVHLAGLAHVTDARTPTAQRTNFINAEATRSLALAAVGAGVRRLVYISTAKVHGEATEVPLRENDPLAPADPYSSSKWAAESAIAEVARNGAIETVVLRPPLVYGPGVKANFRALMALCDTPWPLPLGAIVQNRRSLVYVGNLIAAIRRTLEHPSAAGRTYFSADDGARSTAEIVRTIRTALGRPARLLPVPPEILRASAAIAQRAPAAGRLLESFEIDTGRIRRELDWRPPFSFEHGLAATAAWYRTIRS